MANRPVPILASISTSQAIGWMVLRCLTFSLIAALVRIIGETVHVYQLTFLYNLLSFCVISILVAVFYKRFPKTPFIKLHIYRGLLEVPAIMLFAYSLQFISLPEAMTICFSMPLFITIFSVTLLRETIHKRRVIALVVGFIGVLIALRPGSKVFEFEAVYTLIAVVLWSLQVILVRVIGKSATGFVQSFYLTFFAALFSFPFAWFVWGNILIFESSLICLLSLIFVLHIIAISNALRGENLTMIVPFDFFRIIFSSIIAYLLFGELIDRWTLIGSLIIISSVVYITHREAVVKKHVNPILDPKI